jgi:acetylglutamate kinase
MRILVKLGGRAIETSEQRSLTGGEIAALRPEHQVILVHGGGHRVTTLAERLGIRSTFVDGVRMTSPAEMEVVDMVLAGAVNTEFVRSLNAAGVAAVGLTGADARLITGSALATEDLSEVRTGTPAGVDASVIETLLGAGMTPVCGSVAADERGGALNINADAFAVAVAGAVDIDICLFISDVDGVRVGNQIKERLTRDEVETAIADGEIYGGMIPKVHAATEAVEAGARAAVIGSFAAAGELVDLVKGTRGTRIVE